MVCNKRKKETNMGRNDIKISLKMKNQDLCEYRKKILDEKIAFTVISIISLQHKTHLK